jgi:hypothetical protein
MNDCYKLQEHLYEDAIFKNIDATFIIHLEGNGRMDNIESQLKKFHPSEKVYIFINKGFKKCKKAEYIDKAPLDLIDAFYTIFKEAKNRNYENILILEDDFFFNEDVKLYANDVDDFLKTHNNYIYYLGVIPYLQSYFGEKHHKLFLSTGTHCCIYSKQIIEKTLDIDQQSIIDWDSFLNFNINTIFNRYKYSVPLCYQLFPETENQKHWSGNDFSIKQIYGNIIIYFFKLMQLDKNIYPGYNITENASRFMFWFILITILLLFYFIYFHLLKNKKNKFFNYFLILLIILFYPMFLLSIICLNIYIQTIYFSYNKLPII